MAKTPLGFVPFYCLIAAVETCGNCFPPFNFVAESDPCCVPENRVKIIDFIAGP